MVSFSVPCDTRFNLDYNIPFLLNGSEQETCVGPPAIEARVLEKLNAVF